MMSLIGDKKLLKCNYSQSLISHFILLGRRCAGEVVLSLCSENFTVSKIWGLGQMLFQFRDWLIIVIKIREIRFIGQAVRVFIFGLSRETLHFLHN